MEAGNHGRHKGLTPDPRKIEWESDSVAEEMKEAKLGSAVTFTKSVNHVEFGQEVGGECDELFFGSAPQSRSAVQTIEQLSQLLINVGRQAEEIASLRGLHGSRLSRPLIHILEKMPVDRTVVRNVKVARWQRF